MSSEHAHQKSAQSNHGLILIKAHDQNYPDRQLTKIEALFLDWKKTVQNSKYDLHRSDWRSMSHELLLQILDRSTDKRSRIEYLMKSGLWRKTGFFLSNFKNGGSPLLSLFSFYSFFLLPPMAPKKNKIGRRRRRWILLLTLLYKGLRGLKFGLLILAFHMRKNPTTVAYWYYHLSQDRKSVV